MLWFDNFSCVNWETVQETNMWWKKAFRKNAYAKLQFSNTSGHCKPFDPIEYWEVLGERKQIVRNLRFSCPV